MNSTLPYLCLQAHLAFSQGLPSDQKCQKSLQARLTPTQGQKDSAAKIKDRLTNDKNGQLVTKAKIKRAESANLKGSTSNKLHRNLKVKCSEMPASF
jgi:hypothetical protein